MLFSTMIDVAIIGLLFATMGYAYHVSMRLRSLTEALREIEPIVVDFSESVDRSERCAQMISKKLASITTSDEHEPLIGDASIQKQEALKKSREEMILAFFSPSHKSASA